MTGQTVKVQIESGPKKLYSFGDLHSTIGPNSQWVITGFKTAADKQPQHCKYPQHINPRSSHATLWREQREGVTVDEFAQQIGIERGLILEFIAE